MGAIKNKYEFVILFDVENGNPNGDPDAGNMPRIDPETNHGLVTDVCIKRKIRNFVDMYKEGSSGYNILIKSGDALNTKFTSAYKEKSLKTGEKGKNKVDVNAAQKYMCENYFDVRTFGAVMNTGDDPCGSVTGPVQITFAKSISPIFNQDITITRQARTTVERQETGGTEMGKKSIVPYALYRAEGYISAMIAQKSTGFSDTDLELLWNAIVNMFEHDRSAARGKMTLRKLIIFKHNSVLGDAPAHKLFELVQVVKKDDVETPRAYSDYDVSIIKDTDNYPGVEIIEKA